MFVDDKGIIRFETLDNVAPLHVALNTALSSVSDAIDTDSLVGETSTLHLINNGAELTSDSDTTLNIVSELDYFAYLHLRSGEGSTWLRQHPNGHFYLHAGDTPDMESNTVRLHNSSDLPLGFRRANSSQWIPVAAIAAGRVNITPTAGTPTSLAITFPAGRFTETPVVFTQAVSSVVGTTVLGTGVNGASTSGCTLWLVRSNTSTTSVYWMAVQV